MAGGWREMEEKRFFGLLTAPSFGLLLGVTDMVSSQFFPSALSP